MILRRKQHDTVPLDTVLTAKSKAVPLTGTAVVFNMTPKPHSLGTVIQRSPCELLDPAKGLVRYSWKGKLPPPVNFDATALATGGALASGDYSYQVTAFSRVGETVGSDGVTVTVVGPNGSVALDWDPVDDAVGYGVYRALGLGPMQGVATLQAPTFTDTGGGVPTSDAPPERDESSETSRAGIHRCEWEVTFGDGTIETFPDGDSGDDYFDLEFVADLA